MRKNIKKTLIIIPMIFMLCFSFIGVEAHATDKVDNQSIKNTSQDISEKVIKQTNSDKSTSGKSTSTSGKSTSTSSKSTSTSGKSTSKKSTSNKKSPLLSPNSAGPAGINNELISKDTEFDEDLSTEGTKIDSEMTTEDEEDIEDIEEDMDEDIDDTEEVEEKLPAWKKVDGKLHYVTEDGMVEESGWFMEKDENPDADNDNEYYFDEDYAAVIGWKKIDGSWYYFNEDGVKQTGWILSEYNWYHLDKDGIIEHGWIKIDGAKYYLNDAGIMTRGKKYLDGKWMFFAGNGVLETGMYTSNDKSYYSTKEGEMVANEWVTIGSREYYVKADSSLATGDVIINGVMESFDSDGEYLKSEDMTDHLFVKFLNVGNADCAYMKLPSGETALIDTGDVTTSKTLVNFLKEQNIKKEDGKPTIDYVVISHAHSDHIGGLKAVIENFNVKKVYMPEIAKMEKWYENIRSTSEKVDRIAMLKTEYNVYKTAMKAIKDNKIELENTVKGQYIDQDNILQFVQSDKNFGPLGSDKMLEDYWGINENSAIVYLDYNDLQVLFTGDMSWNSEKDFYVNDLLDGRAVDVLKVPHHGHNTSSTDGFIGYLKPNLGVISRSAENIHKETMDESSVAADNNAYRNLITGGVTVYETSAKDGVLIYATKDGWNLEN